ncbi:CesT family type III secretion system chaperone [Variovorax guangxiensis]|uniref:CesT family type III secretion system chaperone n=1 Tax=Variovorax guangxiensis TaxID=1775474 RepID=UPI002855293B|nr:CesT family type III secretion system chaperone [Variovorax guangxiensis]MDR6856355.1 hypothetical protein [Variovorax guangxiensis]
MNPHIEYSSRDRAIALLNMLPGRLGAGWPKADPDWVALRTAKELEWTLRIEAHEFTFLHSLDAERGARLVVECRCGIAPRSSVTECYRKLLAINHQNFAKDPSAYALDTATKAVIYSSGYLLESLDIDKLTAVVIDSARRAISWQEECAPALDAHPASIDSPLLLQI